MEVQVYVHVKRNSVQTDHMLNVLVQTVNLQTAQRQIRPHTNSSKGYPWNSEIRNTPLNKLQRSIFML